MRPLDLLLLLLTPLMLSAGQFLFKKTALSLEAGTFAQFLLSLLTSPWFWAALVIYGAATLLWVFALSRVPLTGAMPFIAITFVVVPAIGFLFLGERLSLTYWLGVTLIIAGVFATAAAQR